MFKVVEVLLFCETPFFCLLLHFFHAFIRYRAASTFFVIPNVSSCMHVQEKIHSKSEVAASLQQQQQQQGGQQGMEQYPGALDPQGQQQKVNTIEGRPLENEA